MKQIVTHECELCGNRSTCKLPIEKCEASHVAPVDLRIRAAKGYRAGKPYPEYVAVQRPDGLFVIYRCNPMNSPGLEGEVLPGAEWRYSQEDWEGK